VLSQFKKSQYELVDEVLERASEAARMIVLEGALKAMNKFNQREKESE